MPCTLYLYFTFCISYLVFSQQYPDHWVRVIIISHALLRRSHSQMTACCSLPSMRIIILIIISISISISFIIHIFIIIVIVISIVIIYKSSASSMGYTRDQSTIQKTVKTNPGVGCPEIWYMNMARLALKLIWQGWRSERNMARLALRLIWHLNWFGKIGTERNMTRLAQKGWRMVMIVNPDYSQLSLAICQKQFSVIMQ